MRYKKLIKKLNQKFDDKAWLVFVANKNNSQHNYGNDDSNVVQLTNNDPLNNIVSFSVSDRFIN